MQAFRDFLQAAASVKPSANQLRWFDTEFYAFVHFSPNTYTGLEWGTGNEDPAIFNPTELDCDQWTAAIKAAGMKGLILTAKHHDGFCLWPSAYTEHCVKNSPCQKDIVKEAADACRRAGLKFGFYLSPWDRHEASYGTSAYNDYYCNQLTELLTNYGDIFCVWFDNACGEGPNGVKQEYDFPRYIELIRRYQPEAVIFNDYGPDTRWCGNEAGRARHAEWAVVPSELCHLATPIQTGPGPLAEGADYSYQYNPDPDIGSMSNILYSKGLVFCPSEVDTSIRKGWFYHPEEVPRDLDTLFSIYLATVGGNTCLNLNIPPMPSGLFDPKDIARLQELGDRIRAAFSNNLATQAKLTKTTISATQASWTLRFPSPISMHYVTLLEEIAEGQRIESFQLRAKRANGEVFTFYRGTAVGHKKICALQHPVEADELTVVVTASRGEPLLKGIEVY